MTCEIAGRQHVCQFLQSAARIPEVGCTAPPGPRDCGEAVPRDQALFGVAFA
jgi:hypothetical protein